MHKLSTTTRIKLICAACEGGVGNIKFESKAHKFEYLVHIWKKRKGQVLNVHVAGMAHRKI